VGFVLGLQLVISSTLSILCIGSKLGLIILLGLLSFLVLGFELGLEVIGISLLKNRTLVCKQNTHEYQTTSEKISNHL